MKRMLMLRHVLPIVLAIILLQAINVADSQAAPPAGGGFYHTVRYGETLSSIGWRYGVNPYAIARANGLHNPNYIYAGQVLHIPSGQRYYNYSNYNNRYYNGCHNRTTSIGSDHLYRRYARGNNRIQWHLCSKKRTCRSDNSNCIQKRIYITKSVG